MQIGLEHPASQDSIEGYCIFHSNGIGQKPKVDFNDLYDEAKLAERKSFHHAMENAYNKFLGTHSLKDGAAILQSISFNQLEGELHRKIQRLFILLFISEENLIVESAVDVVKKLNLEANQWISPKNYPDPIRV